MELYLFLELSGYVVGMRSLDSPKITELQGKTRARPNCTVWVCIVADPSSDRTQLLRGTQCLAPSSK